MAVVLHPNPELVACAWLSLVFPSAMVGTTLPADNTSWAASGFVMANSVGGYSAVNVPVISSVVGVQFWACAPSSGKPPWGKAANLAETVRMACYDQDLIGARVVLPLDFPDAQVFTAYLVSEPHRALSDPANYARYLADLQINWRPTQ